MSYTAGDWTGTLAKDYIAIQGPSHSWYNRIEAFFVLITESQHFFINDAAWVGILGMAYGSLAKVCCGGGGEERGGGRVHTGAVLYVSLPNMAVMGWIALMSRNTCLVCWESVSAHTVWV